MQNFSDLFQKSFVLKELKQASPDSPERSGKLFIGSNWFLYIFIVDPFFSAKSSNFFHFVDSRGSHSSSASHNCEELVAPVPAACYYFLWRGQIRFIGFLRYWLDSLCFCLWSKNNSSIFDLEHFSARRFPDILLCLLLFPFMFEEHKFSVSLLNRLAENLLCSHYSIYNSDSIVCSRLT